MFNMDQSLQSDFAIGAMSRCSPVLSMARNILWVAYTVQCYEIFNTLVLSGHPNVSVFAQPQPDRNGSST